MGGDGDGSARTAGMRTEREGRQVRQGTKVASPLVADFVHVPQVL